MTIFLTTVSTHIIMIICLSKLFYWIFFPFFLQLSIYLNFICFSAVFLGAAKSFSPDAVVRTYKTQLIITSLLLWDAAATQRQSKQIISYWFSFGLKPKIDWSFSTDSFFFRRSSNNPLNLLTFWFCDTMGIEYGKCMFNISEMRSGNHMDTVFCSEMKNHDKHNASTMAQQPPLSASNYSHSWMPAI